MSIGQFNVGDSSSTTVTVKLHSTTFGPSVSVYVITLSPNPNWVDATTGPIPELIVAPVITYVNSKSGQLSTANNGSNSPALLAHVHAPTSALIVKSSGHTNSGSSLSTTSNVNEHVLVFPEPSVAVYSISYVPTAKGVPLYGPPAEVSVTVTSPQLSCATGILQITLPEHDGSTPTVKPFVGQFTKTGDSLSEISIKKVVSDTQSPANVAVTVTTVVPSVVLAVNEGIWGLTPVDVPSASPAIAPPVQLYTTFTSDGVELKSIDPT